MERLSLDDMQDAGLDVEDRSKIGPIANKRRIAPLGVIIHTPGSAFVERCGRTARSDSDVDIDDEVARRFDSRKYRPGYLVGQSGRVYVLDSDDRRPMHAGSLSVSHYSVDWADWCKPLGGNGYQRHRRPAWVVYDWYEALHGRENPSDVFPWRRAPNNAIGIDIRPSHLDGSHSDEQHEALRKLVNLLSDAHGFPVDSTHVTTHSYASPLERGSVLRRGKVIGTHWDPPLKKFDYQRIIS